jgi:hypothetical protein
MLRRLGTVGQESSMTRVLLTYREYAALPEDGRRHEIHDGELCVTPSPSPRHQKVSGKLFGDGLAMIPASLWS